MSRARIIALYRGPNLSVCAYDEHQALLIELAARRVWPAVDLIVQHLKWIEARLNLDRARRDCRSQGGLWPGEGEHTTIVTRRLEGLRRLSSKA